MRVAEQVSLLDHLSDGRLILGIGRGLGRVEFEGFRLEMAASRGRFVESAQMLLEGLEKGACELDGEHVRQPRRDIRPRPFRSFRGRTYAAAVSPESSRIMAELGVGILIIPQKPWDVVARELDEYRRIFREVQGRDAPAPIAAAWVFCDEDADRARELARRYVGEYWRSVIRHYELDGDHLARTQGYESYARTQEIVRQSADAMVDFALSLQVWGTPEQCLERIREIRARVGNDHFVGVFSYAGMPRDEAERNLRLFARSVLPEMRRLGPAA
jgi:alkanesulfonate monooxygenase SsuD/methylene tetrahydromethanopterin reductase-like flavin-dependent oxidoreductase (luciferase family)